MADPFVIEQSTVVIANGQSLSPEVDVGPKTLVGIITPSTWAAAGISFQASPDGGTTWLELLDQTATAIGVSSITGAQFIAIDPTKLKGVTALKVRSGTSGTPVAQSPGAGGTTLILLRRAVF